MVHEFTTGKTLHQVIFDPSRILIMVVAKYLIVGDRVRTRSFK